MACCQKKEAKSRTRSWEDIYFTPKYSVRPLTEKFYSKYENVDAVMHQNISKNVDIFAQEIEARMKYERKDHYLGPYTENQVYGWYDRVEYRQIMDEADRDIMFFPLKVDEMMSIMKKISIDMKRERDHLRL